MTKKSGVDITCEGDTAVAVFQSTCVSDVEEITTASARIRDFINQHQPRGIVFDFSGVKFFSSQVLGLLLEARAQLQPQRGQVAVCALDEQLHRVFKITNLDKIFTFHYDRQAAVAELSWGDPAGSTSPRGSSSGA
jgi:anti-sigma B factor antagonist